MIGLKLALKTGIRVGAIALTIGGSLLAVNHFQLSKKEEKSVVVVLEEVKPILKLSTARQTAEVMIPIENNFQVLGLSIPGNRLQYQAIVQLEAGVDLRPVVQEILDGREWVDFPAIILTRADVDVTRSRVLSFDGKFWDQTLSSEMLQKAQIQARGEAIRLHCKAGSVLLEEARINAEKAGSLLVQHLNSNATLRWSNQPALCEVGG